MKTNAQIAQELRERMDAEGCHIEPFWRRPGIRIWRSLECRPILSPAIRQKASDCLGAACERLQGQLGGDVLSVSVPQAPSVDFGSIPTLVPAEGLQPTWRTIPSDGWSDFDKDGILSPKTEDETRWVEAFKTVGDSFSEWSKSNRPDSGARDVRNRFQGVHADPRRLFAERRAVFEFLERDKIETERIAGETDPLAKTWEIVTRLTKERKDIQMRLRQECKDFALARNHYVGWVFPFVGRGDIPRGISGLCRRAVVAWTFREVGGSCMWENEPCIGQGGH